LTSYSFNSVFDVISLVMTLHSVCWELSAVASRHSQQAQCRLCSKHAAALSDQPAAWSANHLLFLLYSTAVICCHNRQHSGAFKHLPFFAAGVLLSAAAVPAAV
jgi:hypothetical protein